MTDTTEIVAPASDRPLRRKSQLARVGKMRDEFQAGLEADANVLGNHQLAGVTRRWAEQSTEDCDGMINALVAVRALIAPRDMVEEMIVMQMIGMQEAAMRNMMRACGVNLTTEFVDKHLAIANKCSRTFAALVETLNRHRGKGQQKVTVEHVHVHAGGQAIVGAVQGGGKAGGDAETA